MRVASVNSRHVADYTNAYDEYGNPPVVNNVNQNGGRFQYTGQMWLDELGVYYYKARMYSPTLGRFMQTDPIGYGDNANMYAYTHDDPINGSDPSGLQDAPAAPWVVSVGNEAAQRIVVTATRGCGMFCEVITGAEIRTVLMDIVDAPLIGFTYFVSSTSVGVDTCPPGARSCGVILQNKNAGKEPSDGAKPGRKTKGPSKQFEKPGGTEEANEDFDATKPKDVQSKGNGIRVGTLSDGRTIVVRPVSTDGRPTVEVRGPNGRGYEVRYGR